MRALLRSAACHAEGVLTLARALWLLRQLLLLLRYHFSRIELNKHCAIGFQLFNGNGKTEVI